MNTSEFDINVVAAEVIDRNIERLVDSLKKAISDEINKNKACCKSGYKSYLTNAYKKYSKVKTILYRIEPKFIYDFFECNTLSYGNKTISSENIDDVLKISHNIIIEGTGGIGKSTLLKHFFINMLSKKNLIPIFVKLKEMSRGSKSLLDCIYKSLTNLGFNLGQEYLEHALNSGRFVFLLDGLDEIASDEYDDSISDLCSFCDKYNDNYFIITSRPNDSFISFQRFTILKSLPFSKEQSLSLVKKLEYGDIDIKDKFVYALDNVLYDKYESFASNPLLLNIMLLTYDNYADIPEKLHIFYSQAFETLYSKHDATKGGYKREMKSKLSYDDFVRIFAKLCFITYSKNAYEFTKTELLDYIKEAAKGYEIDHHAFLKDLTDAICVLYLDGLNFIFTHRSFQEYFTAVFLKELSDKNQSKVCLYLINKEVNILHDSVLNMLFDINSDKFKKNILLPILDKLEFLIQEDTDRYKQFFKFLIRKVHFMPEDKVSFITSVSFVENREFAFLQSFILRYRNYLEKLRYNIKTTDMVPIDQLPTKKIFIPCEDILENEKLFGIIEFSWIGELVFIAQHLRKVIKNELEELDEEIELYLV